MSAPRKDIWGWLAGLFFGLFLPALAAVLLSLLWFKKPGDHLINPRAGFFGCLSCSAALAAYGGRGWKQTAFCRGLAVGALLWVSALPLLAGDCTQ